MQPGRLSRTFRLVFPPTRRPAPRPSPSQHTWTHKRVHSHTFAGLAICLQLKAVVAVAGGPVECGDTVVLAAQLRTGSLELCVGAGNTPSGLQTGRPHPDCHLPPTPVKPWETTSEARHVGDGRGFRNHLIYFASEETETQGGYKMGPRSHSQLWLRGHSCLLWLLWTPLSPWRGVPAVAGVNRERGQ